MSGFDSIDKKHRPAKPQPVLLKGSWYWDSDDPDNRYDSVDEVMWSVNEGLIIKVWEGGVTREFFAVTMRMVDSDPDAPYDETETREFATEEEAKAWVSKRQAELEEHDRRLEIENFRLTEDS